jgi:predicted amidohydrolase YtcJ
MRLRLRDGLVADIGDHLDPGDDEVLDSGDGAVLPGLHDHHIHLRAVAAARSSVEVGPDADLATALRQAPGPWVRAVGWAGGDLDRWQLDRLLADRPVRVQHRSGALWILNSAAAQAVGLPDDHDGRLFRQDDWLRDRLPPADHDLAPVGTDALAWGVTAFTDTTPDRTPDEAEMLRAALPQRLHLMMPLGVATTEPVKILLDDVDLPTVEALATTVAAAHADGRGVAVHCVTRVQLVVALAAGLGPGDRIEHGAIIDPDLDGQLRERQLTVVTQPNFVVERHAQYERDVDPADRPLLYRCRSLLQAGIRVLGGTDAPFGGADPWAAMRAAVERDLNPDERVTPRQALDLFLDRPAVRVGDSAELCVLGVPLEVALRELDAANVVQTLPG